MAKNALRNPKAAPLLDELRSIEACSPEDNVGRDASLCLLRVVPGLDASAWDSLSREHSLEQWCAVSISGPAPAAQSLAQALGLAAAASGLQDVLRTEIERSRACQLPLAVALIQPDGPPASSPLLQDLLELALGLKRSFDHAALAGPERLAVVYSGSPLSEAERMAGAMLRRMRALSGRNGAGSGLLCSAGLAGYGGCGALSPDEIIRRAAQALDSARGQGGNRLEVAPSADSDMAPRDSLVRASEKHFLFTGKFSGGR